jgi:hypothetical protein
MSSMRDTSVGRMNWRHITENTAIYYNMSSMRDTSVGRMNKRHNTGNTAIYYNKTTCLQWETPLSEEWIKDTVDRGVSHWRHVLL